MIQLREFTDDDYPAFSGWWQARGAASPALELLPRTGHIAEANAHPIAAGFLYLDAARSGCCWIGWIITDPAAPRISAGRACHHLIHCLERIAKSLGYWLIFATTSHPSLQGLLTRLGYTAGDTGLVHFTKPL